MAKEKKSESAKADSQEMSLEEAKAWRTSLGSKKRELSNQEKQKAFRLYWAQEKYKFGKGKDLEHVLWLHLKATKQDEPEQFENGLKHFGLQKKIR